VTNDRNVADREAGTPDTRPDGGAPDTGTPEGGTCVGGGDAARDGAIGMAAVQALRCANCHQDDPVDAGLILSGKLTSIVNDAGVYPRNLTPDPMTGLGCWTDDQIAKAILDGVNEEGNALCTRMPRYNTQIDAGVAQEIVNFLRTLKAVHKEIPETVVCPPRPPPPEPQPEGGTDADGAAPPHDSGPDGTAPDGTAPDGGAPDGTAPDGTAPDGGAPPDAGPDATAPDGGPDGAVPDVAVDTEADIQVDNATDIVVDDVDIDGG
jgi:hypothetical protein